MSLIDDLKDMMQRASIPESKANAVIIQVSKRYGGQYPYVRHNTQPNCRKKTRR